MAPVEHFFYVMVVTTEDNMFFQQALGPPEWYKCGHEDTFASLLYQIEAREGIPANEAELYQQLGTSLRLMVPGHRITWGIVQPRLYTYLVTRRTGTILRRVLRRCPSAA